MSVAHSARGDVARARHLRHKDRATLRARILVVDDDEHGRQALERLLRAEGFATWGAADGEAALAEVERALPDLVVADLTMPRMGGVELCKRLHQLDQDLPVIMMTAHSDLHSAIESLRERADDYLIKPLQDDAVVWSVERALARRAAKLEQEGIRRTLNERLVLSSIREQEHAEAEAQHAAQLEALLENLREGVLMANARTGVVMINEAARELSGLLPEAEISVADLDALEVRDLDDRPLSIEERPLGRALRGERFTDCEVVRVTPSGERRHLVYSGTSVTDEDGNVSLAVVVFRDVTEMRRLEQQRDEYLSMISHDLRNPLSVVLMSVVRLKAAMTDKRLPRAARVEIAERVERNARRMNAMLDELREATSLEAHGVVLHRSAWDMRDLVTNVVDSLDDELARRITIETDDASPYLVFVDAPRIERVVANLLTNALKYSAEDTVVSVRLARTGRAVSLDVVDRGIGIAPESLKRLFERHYRTTGGKARASGLGLGLYIAGQIVELHGGRIDIASELGKGSTFTLTLPLHD